MKRLFEPNRKTGWLGRVMDVLQKDREAYQKKAFEMF